MKEVYRPDLKAHVSLDDKQRIRAIRHTQEYWLSDQASPMGTAISYLNSMAKVYGVPTEQLASLHRKVSYLDPVKRDPEYRLSEEKPHFDATTLGFYQTYMNTPVWRAGFKVTIKQGPSRVIRSVDTSQEGIDAKLPPKRVIEKYKSLFSAVELVSVRRRAGEVVEKEQDAAGVEYLKGVIGLAPDKKSERAKKAPEGEMRLIRGRFWVYKYDEEARIRKPRPKKHAVGETAPEDLEPPTLPLPPVDKRIRDGQYYFVAEITFSYPTPEFGRLNWRALVELETGSVLYLRPLVGFVNGLVFIQDPISATGDTSLTSDKDNATLNPHRDDEPLLRLDAPVDSVQHLKGSYAEVKNLSDPAIDPPTEPAGTDFDYDVRTNDFAAVSAYYHTDKLFAVIESLGWSPIANYFAKTDFPVPVDHRSCIFACPSGEEINGFCSGDGTGGIDSVEYMLNDTTDTGNPVGRAADPRIHWHEVCGHGVLFEHVDDGFFNFSHSAGDGLSGIFYDPESQAKGVDGTPVGKPGDLRFTYVPWHPTLDRRFDRDVSAGWAWGGSHDNAGYGSEEILATTHFRIYRSIGGDSTDLGRRQFASRMMIYLILRAIQNLTPATNPDYARDFAAELMAADQLNWTSEGVYGGAYHKVIRWSFEKQGEYRTPLLSRGDAAFGTVTSPGDPPDVDVYIDDGRAGEYQYQAAHWHTTTIWNRRLDDGLVGHQEPVLGETNYAYVKIKNRGTQQANNVVVRGYHTKPGVGLLWPGDFEAFDTAEIVVGTLAANNSEEKIVGPFEWTPNINAYGHDCMLMVVSADGDAANTDNFTVGEVIPEWRLVPNDNNIGQRNVQPVPGGGGAEGLMEGLDGLSFWVGNPNPKKAVMKLRVDLPPMLKAAGWRLSFQGIRDDRFELASGQKREVVMRLHPGRDFARDEVEAIRNRDIQIAVFADDNLMGGMTYRLDPDLRHPFNRLRPGKPDCSKEAQALIECLGVRGRRVKKADIKEIVIGVRLRDDKCC